MRVTLVLCTIIIAGLASPANGQDFLQPLEEMFESLTPRQERAQPRPPAATPAPVPQQRPEAAAEEEEPATEEEIEMPRPRPEPVEAEPVEAEEPVAEEEEVAPVEEAAEPEAVEEPEPEEAARVYQTACPAVLLGLVEAEALPPLTEAGCTEQSPLSVTAVLSRGRMVPLSQPVITNCEMASALPGWVQSVDSYALATQDAQLETVLTGTGYMCRNRNNAASGDTSEHGFANAVDVTGFTLSDGRSIGVEADWMPASAGEGRLLRFAHDAACTGFTTVLGPEANALHHDHFHLDLGCHGQSCTARLCE